MTLTVSVQDYKDAMSRLATGVTIVTAHGEDHPYGITVSAFTSVSIDPPMVLVCIDNRGSIRNVIQKSGHFAVHILGEDQQTLGMRFASPQLNMVQRFEGISHKQDGFYSPVIPDALASLDCHVHSAHEAGDHTVFFGTVMHCHLGNPKKPLVYHQRHWGTVMSSIM